MIMKRKRITASVISFCLLFSLLLFAAAKNLPGDVDGNGQVSAADARLCLRRAVDLENYARGSAEYTACDVTLDGEVTSADARMILRAAVGLETLGLPETDLNNNEYNILRSGSFYAVGSMETGGEIMPLEIALTPKTIYMRTEMDGLEMAVLQDAKNKIYLLNPAKKNYMELTKVAMDMMGMSAEDLFDTENLGFSDMPALSEADVVSTGEFNGSPCTVFTFYEEDNGRTYVYMYGNKLLGFENATSYGVSDVTYITSISSTVPSDKTAPPKDYRRVLMVVFMSEMANALG